jgi:Flp pilus assembly protein TadG
MLKTLKSYNNVFRSQRGVAAVEFAIIAMLLFTVLFGILELGRLFYVFNSVQEVTRRAAREAVVRWAVDSTSEEDEIKRLALFGATANLPAGAEITPARITIEYLNGNRAILTTFPDSPSDNITECLSGPTGCIAYVRVSITGATYAPMVSLFPYLRVPIPASTVTMPAESMGYSG